MTHMEHGLAPIEPDYKAERDLLARAVKAAGHWPGNAEYNRAYELAQRILKEIEDEPR